MKKYKETLVDWAGVVALGLVFGIMFAEGLLK